MYNINGAVRNDPYAKARLYNKEDIEALKQYLDSSPMNNEYSVNSEIAKLCSNFSNYLGGGYSIATNSGTNALLAAYMAAIEKQHCEVIVQANTFFSTATPLINVCANILIVDVHPVTGNIRLDEIKKMASDETKVIVVTHMWMPNEEILDIRKYCDQKNICLIEDASLAIGGKVRGKKIGSFGHISVTSAGSTKLLSGGQGGLLWTNSKKIHDRAKIACKFTNKGRDSCLESLSSSGIGFNSQIHILSSVVINNRLKNIDRNYRKRIMHIPVKMNTLSGKREHLRFPKHCLS